MVCDEKHLAHRKRNIEVVFLLGRPAMLLYLEKSLIKMVLSWYCQSYGAMYAIRDIRDVGVTEDKDFKGNTLT